MPDSAPDILAAALAAHDAGLCVIRARTDGTKAPLGKWEQWQHQRPTREEVAGWFGTGHPGLGVVCGNVSGDLEMFELEGRFMADHGAEFLERVRAAGIELVFRRLINGYQMESPKAGRNFVYRVDGPVDGNTKLARDADSETLIETRGEGGFIVLAPSHGPVHPSGKPWKVREGSIEGIPTITVDEREALFAVARGFDEAPVVAPPPPTSPTQRTRPAAWAGGAVGESWYDAVTDHLAAAIDMQTLLERHGWTFCYVDGRGRKLMRRPGKDEGVSGSVNENGRFCPFSTSVPFASGGGGKLAPTYDHLDVIAVYEHSGDRDAAARDIAEATGILDTWKAQQDVELRIAPSRIDPATGEVTRGPLPDEFWAHPRLAHVRQAAHARGRAPAAVLACVLVRIAAELDHRLVLPPIVGSDGSLNLAASLIGIPGAGKSTSDALTEELLDFTGRLPDPRPRGLPLGSGEGVAEAFMHSRTATDDEKEAGLATKGIIREQGRWNERFIGDEGAAVITQGKRQGATLLETLRTLVTGGTLGQQNAATDNRRMIHAHTYRASVLLGFQISTAVGLLDDAAGGTPQRFLFASAVDPTVPPPGERPNWPGPLTVDLPDASWIETLTNGPRGRRRVPVCDAAIARVLADDHQRQTGANVDPLGSHANLVRLQIATHLGVLLYGRPEVTDEMWTLAGDLQAHGRLMMRLVAEHARSEAREREQAESQRLADRQVVANAKTEAHRTVECAKRILTAVKGSPGIPVSHVRRDLRRWREDFDHGLAHAIDEGWIDERHEAGQGAEKRCLYLGEKKP